MHSISRLRPSPALIVAMAALVMAMSGAAIALPGKNSVKKNDIENGAVTKKKIAKGAVGSQQIKGKSIKGNRLKDGAVKDKQIADATITGAKVAPDGLDSSNIADYKVFGQVKVTATDGADDAAARAAAPENVLFEKGQLTIYAKCFRNTGTNTTIGEVYARTTENGAIMEGEDDLPGGNAATDFLNTNTAEVDRQLDNEDATGTDANYNETEYLLASPDGTAITGQIGVAAKNGELAGGNGIYGAGNVCLFQGSAEG